MVCVYKNHGFNLLYLYSQIINLASDTYTKKGGDLYARILKGRYDR